VDHRRIYTDKVSGSRADRPGLEKCLAALDEGDVLVVYKLDRLGRSLRHLVDLVEDLQKRGVGLKSLQDGIIDTTTASGKLIFGIFSVIAEFERELIRERTHTGLAAARVRGRKGGRKPLAADDPKVLLTKMHYLEGQKSIAEICELLSISPPTVYRRLRAAGVKIGAKGNSP
jgi:DNA invertase Pin-like site-specific DNA recombinase